MQQTTFRGHRWHFVYIDGRWRKQATFWRKQTISCSNRQYLKGTDDIWPKQTTGGRRARPASSNTALPGDDEAETQRAGVASLPGWAGTCADVVFILFYFFGLNSAYFI